MKIYKQINCLFIGALVVLFINTGCKKLIEVDPPDGWLESGTVFSNDAQATAAVMGLYSTIMGQNKYLLNGGMSLFAGLSADELVRTSKMNNEDQFANNDLPATNSLIHNNLWRPAYAYLYQCNVIVKGLERSNSVTQAAKERLASEAKFVRALCYYYLINLFDDVPLVLSLDADENASMPRHPKALIYGQIVNDLQDAFEGLPDISENTRPNKFACQALLARVFLNNRDWANAERAASIVINSAHYQLVADLSEVFVSDSRETIFQLAPVLDNYNTAEGYMFIPFNGNFRPVYIVTNNLLAAFEVGDNRKTSWLQTAQPGGVGPFYTFPQKYRTYSSEILREYNIVLRLAEQYLIRAEARMQQENVAGAVEDINFIRNRAGLSDILSTVSKEECTAVLEQERRIEMFAEWGHRWIDLKRWNKADSILFAVKGSDWHATDKLYPIPASEREKNSALGQNDGY